MKVRDLAQAARIAALKLATAPAETRDKALAAIADALTGKSHLITKANETDLENARESGLASPLLKRLAFDERSIESAVQGVMALRDLPDPVGKVISATELDNGLVLKRTSCPIGVIGVIFESRPDALVQISTLCLKSGNATLLKGGSEALHTNRILGAIIEEASIAAGAPAGWINLIETRTDVSEMLGQDDCIDLIIPRGSNEFVRHIMDNSRIPVMGHADGICHIYIDKAADTDMAADIVEDAKCQYVAVCNAVETLLVHREIAETFLPKLKERLDKRNVQLRTCPVASGIIGGVPATEDDWRSEYLDYILAVKVVDSLEDAMSHINHYGSGHTDAIVTNDGDAAEVFLLTVDSGNVFHNASTRFADGFRYGLGAEVGISTSKIHARGPVGLEGLMSYKWELRGEGQTVAPYASGEREFTHIPLK